MPPEVIEKNDYSKQSDVWSFGVFLWETLSCKVPFSNYDFHVVMYAVRKFFKFFTFKIFLIDCKKRKDSSCTGKLPN